MFKKEPTPFQREQKTESELAEERRQEALRQRKEGQPTAGEGAWQEVDLPEGEKETSGQ